MTFPEYQYTKDQNGDDLLLKDGTYQVMMAWEKPYMEACIKELHPFGDVLEVGFGLGYSASAIQQFPIASHTIIEYHPVVAEKTREWAQDKTGVILVEDTWQNALQHLTTFDSIFFDDYPLETKKEHTALLGYKEKNIQNMNISIPEQEQPISQEEFTGFFDHLLNGEMTVVEPRYLFSFIHNLVQEGAISEEDKRWAIHEAKQKGLLSDADCVETASPSLRSSDRLQTFLRICLENHMKKGSRFSCYLESNHSRFEDPFFYNEIILNPHLIYSEKEISVAPPQHCAYFTEATALVITIEKC